MELIRKPIHYTQAGKNIFHQFYHDEDYNVPEQREDVGRIICGSAGLRSSDIRPVENGIRITGTLDFHILYMTSSGDPKPAALEGKIPFEETVYTETDGNETFYLCNARVEFTPVLINGRKLMLKFMAEMELGREWIRDAELTENVESDVPLCRKMRKMTLLKLMVSKKDTYRIREEVALRRRASDRSWSPTSASGGWTSVRDRMRSNCRSSACICRTGSTDHLPAGPDLSALRGVSCATASRKACTTISGMN